jgi:putative sigma-54 modulation protein
MRLDVTGRNVTITPALQQLIDRKLAKLDRLLSNGIVSAQVVFSLQKYRHVLEVTVHARGDHMLHGVGTGTAWPMSAKGAFDALTQQAQKLKTKWKERKRRGAGTGVLAAKTAAVSRSHAEAAETAGPRVVRARRYLVKPMTVEDAALRVSADGDAFIVFRNATTDAINILYRRNDGNLGLIEPEV